MSGLQQTDDARGSKRKLTSAEFLRFPDDGRRHELIDGEHYVTASPNRRHQELSVRLTLALGNYLERHPVGVVFHARLDCVLSMFDVVEPDLLVVLNDQAGILTKKNVQGAPAIMVEILSPGTVAMDEETKRDLYERSGAREYWVIDPEADCVVVHRLARKRFSRAVVLDASAGHELTTPLLPGFSLVLADFFRD